MNWKLVVAVVAVMAFSTFTLAQVLGTTMSGPSPWIDVTAYGAKGDAQVSTEKVTSDTCSTPNSTSLVLTCISATPIFVASDTGKAIEVPIIGGGTLLTRIDVVTSPPTNTVTLHDPVGVVGGSGNVPVTWGTDNHDAVQAAMSACPASGKGCVVYFPAGNYMFGAGVSMATQTSFQVIAQGNSGRAQNSIQAGVRLLTSMPIVIMTLGQSSPPNQGGFQLWNFTFVDTTSIGVTGGAAISGNALGGLDIIDTSEALIAESNFEHFNGLVGGIGHYGMKAELGGGTINNLFLLHDKGQDNLVWYDGTAVQDGPIVIGGDIFPSTSVNNGVCYGIKSMGPIRVFGTHFDVGTAGPSGPPCFGIQTPAGQIYGKFEASDMSHQGNGVDLIGTSGVGAEVDAIFNDEVTAVTIESGSTNNRIIENVAGQPNTHDILGQGSSDTVEIHHGSLGNTFQFGGSPSPTTFSVSDLGSSALPWENLFLAGSGASPNYFKITGTPTGTARTITLPDASTTLVGQNTTDTFTNKTEDAEATGNVITRPLYVQLDAAKCNNATATAMLDLPTSNAPTPACLTFTNNQQAVLDFTDASIQSAFFKLPLPTGWTGNIDLDLYWLVSAAGGSNAVNWRISTVCVADGDSFDATYNTAQTVTTNVEANSNLTISTRTGVTTTGCASNEVMKFKIGRDNTDTFTGTARLLGVRVRERYTK